MASSTKIPPKLKVGPFEYSIEESEPKTSFMAHNGDMCLGYTDRNTLEIVLVPHLVDRMKSITLFHELMHTVWGLANLEHEDEEEYVTTLTPLLLQVLRENPQVTKYILEGK